MDELEKVVERQNALCEQIDHHEHVLLKLRVELHEANRAYKELTNDRHYTVSATRLCDRCAIRPKTHSKEGVGCFWHYCDECDPPR